MRDERDPDLALSRLGELMRHVPAAMSRQEHLEGRARLIASVERMRRPAWTLRRAGLGVASLAAAAALVLAVGRLRREPAPVGWHVENATVSRQGDVHIASTAPSARLVFDDGSDVALAPGSRGRVSSTTPFGAEVVLERGRARFRVQHRASTRWTVDVGPFAVHVTGTEFTVALTGDSNAVDVWMRSGRVEVTGPGPGEAWTLAAGQHLRAGLRDVGASIDTTPEPDDVDASAPEPASVPADGGAPPAPSVPAAANAGKPAAGPSWPKLVALGDYARVVDEAGREGEDRALGGRPLADLRALGDAARYAGNAGLARRAYLTVRSRFAASPDARTSAFLLGRVAEEQEHADSEALRWYDAYLAEAPAGAFAGDALGRKMVIVEKSQGREAARRLAKQYLARFPNGPYSVVAHDVGP